MSKAQMVAEHLHGMLGMYRAGDIQPDHLIKQIAKNLEAMLAATETPLYVPKFCDRCKGDLEELRTEMLKAAGPSLKLPREEFHADPTAAVRESRERHVDVVDEKGDTSISIATPGETWRHLCAWSKKHVNLPSLVRECENCGKRYRDLRRGIRGGH